MASPSMSGMFQVGVNILNSVVDATKGTITYLTGDVVSQTPETDNVEAWGQIGLLSRPSNPQAGSSAAECITIRRGDRDVSVCSRDTRGQLLAGNLGPGETMLYGGGADGNAQGRVMIKKDGSVTIMTTDTNTSAGKAVALTLSPSKLAFSAPWGSFVFDATGFHMKMKAGPRIDMGGVTIPGIPSSISGLLTSYITLTASKIQTKAAVVLLGVGPVFNTAVMSPSSTLTTPGLPITTGPTSQSGGVRVSST